jgi:hypothetical protein
MHDRACLSAAVIIYRGSCICVDATVVPVTLASCRFLLYTWVLGPAEKSFLVWDVCRFEGLAWVD